MQQVAIVFVSWIRVYEGARLTVRSVRRGLVVERLLRCRVARDDGGCGWSGLGQRFAHVAAVAQSAQVQQVKGAVGIKHTGLLERLAEELEGLGQLGGAHLLVLVNIVKWRQRAVTQQHITLAIQDASLGCS